jgi:hypothetical protein
MPAEDRGVERRNLGNVLRGRQAAAILAELAHPADATTLELDGARLTEVNVFGAAVVRTGIEVHLARDPANRVSLVEPDNSECWEHLSDLLGLPTGRRWRWAGTRSPAGRGTDVLVPAMPVRDSEDVKLITDEGIRVVAGALGYGARTGHLMEEAAAVFLHNVDQHARSHAIAPVICAAFHPPSNDMQVVVVNLEEPGHLVIATQEELDDAIARSQANHGSLDDLGSLSRGGLVFTVRLMAGTSRAHRRSGGSWQGQSVPESVPGFVAGLEVHR